jgi:hypothetical protein
MLVIYRYRFSYQKKTDSYKEYDGKIVNAPDEDVAWKIFRGIDGEFKLPAAVDYTCERIGIAYHFTAGNIAVLQDKYGFPKGIDPDKEEDMRLAWLEAVELGEVD